MFRESSDQFFPVTRRHPVLQSFKMKSTLFIVSVAAVCLITLSLTSASPFSTETSTSSSTTEAGSANSTLPAVGYLNGSKLVITHVVKTLEFEVDLEEDDGNSTETDGSSTPFFETDIDVLNPALLEEVIEQSHSSKETMSADGTKDLKNAQGSNGA